MTGSGWRTLLDRALWIDIEASGLGPDSHPIEIGWADVTGASGSILIRPASEWRHWDAAAQAVHGIDRRDLVQHGLSVGEAADIVARIAQGRYVLSDSPPHDGFWLARLFQAANRPLPIDLAEADTFALWLAEKAGVDERAWDRAERQARRLAPISHRAAADALHWATLARLLVDGR